MPVLPSSSLSFTLPQLTKVGLALGSLAIGQWLINDVIHVPGGTFGFLFAAGGIWWLSRPQSARFDTPVTLQGWIDRCRLVLDQFEKLDEEGSAAERNAKRMFSLNQVLGRNSPQSLALVATSKACLPDQTIFESVIKSPQPINIGCSPLLPTLDETREWPKELYEKDLLIYGLQLPFKAVDLLWLGSVPDDQPAWVLIAWDDISTWPDQLKALQAQLPHRWEGRILRWTADMEYMDKALTPVRQALLSPKKNIDITRQRLLSKLHSTWQLELETLRRDKFYSLQQRSQWLVAGAVFASPVPSTDLLAVAVVNGLMIQEMSKIWQSSWSPETLQLVAKQLAAAALAQGVVEWTGNALLGMAKLDGNTWLAAGTLQALSAAYLTRVVGSSMADWLALNNGVEELDLESLKEKAPQLIARAADKERLDWTAFLVQSKNWIAGLTQETPTASIVSLDNAS